MRSFRVRGFGVIWADWKSVVPTLSSRGGAWWKSVMMGGFEDIVMRTEWATSERRGTSSLTGSFSRNRRVTTRRRLHVNITRYIKRNLK